MNNKVGIYTRVSSETQVLEGHSLEWQEHDLIEYAKSHNLHVVDKYIEKGISGEEIETRPQLLRLIDDIKNKRIDNILVYKIDRLGRQVLTNAKIYKIMRDNNCLLTTSAYGVIDLDKAYDTFMYNMLSSVSQFEVNNLSERVINGKKQRARNGLYINSNSVYGYDNYYDRYSGDRLLKVNEFESQILKEIFNSYLNGISMNKIAKELNIKMTPSKRGGKWCQSTIYQILTNKLYIGIVIYRGKAKKEYFENKGVHTPIIDEDIFYKVQELIQSKKKKKIKKSSKEYAYFSSVLVSKDNAIFKPKQTKAKDKKSIRYYCNDKNNKIASIKHIELEKIFARELQNVNLKYDEKVIKSIFQNNDYEIILKLLNKVKQEQNNLFEYYNNDIISENDLKDRLVIINSKKEELLKEQEKLKNKIVDYNDITKNQVHDLLNNNLMTNFLNLKQKDKMNFVNLFIDKIVINELHNISIIWKNTKKAMS